MPKKKLKISKRFLFIPFFVVFCTILAIFLTTFFTKSQKNIDKAQPSANLKKSLSPWKQVVLAKTEDNYIQKLKWEPLKLINKKGKISFYLDNKWHVLYEHNNWNIWRKWIKQIEKEKKLEKKAWKTELLTVWSNSSEN